VNATVVLGRQGRLVVPVEMRAELGLEAGDRLHVRVEDGRLVLERPEAAVRALRQLGAGVARRSLVDELLAERRAEVAAG